MTIGETVAKRLELIGELSPEDRQALSTLGGDIRDLRRGDEILVYGQRPKESIVVISGCLHRYTISPQGPRQIHSFYLPTDTPCMETLHIDKMDNTLGAIAPSRIGVIPHSEMFRVMEERPTILGLVWRDTLIQASIFREWLMRNSRMLAHSQMAHFFCEMMTRAIAAGIARDFTCELPITQEDLADALGMSPVYVNRTLMMLRTTHLVEFRGGVLTINDWPRLAEIADFDPAYLHLHPLPEGGA